MCVQCAAGAMAAGASATGMRAWIATRSAGWLTPPRRHRITAALIVCGLIASATLGPSPA